MKYNIAFTQSLLVFQLVGTYINITMNSNCVMFLMYQHICDFMLLHVRDPIGINKVDSGELFWMILIIVSVLIPHNRTCQK